MPKDKGEAKPVMEERLSIKAELLDEVLKDYRGPQDFEVIFRRFKKAVVERALRSRGNPALGLRQGRGKAGASNQPPKRIERQADLDRPGESRDRSPPRPGQQLRAAANQKGRATL